MKLRIYELQINHRQFKKGARFVEYDKENVMLENVPSSPLYEKDYFIPELKEILASCKDDSHAKKLKGESFRSLMKEIGKIEFKETLFYRYEEAAYKNQITALEAHIKDQQKILEDVKKRYEEFKENH